VKVYRAQFRADFYVMAESDEDALETAKVYVDLDSFRRSMHPCIDVYCTPNQGADLQRQALNYEDTRGAVGKPDER
jgi:hypothetical protein